MRAGACRSARRGHCRLRFLTVTNNAWRATWGAHMAGALRGIASATRGGNAYGCETSRHDWGQRAHMLTCTICGKGCVFRAGGGGGRQAHRHGPLRGCKSLSRHCKRRSERWMKLYEHKERHGRRWKQSGAGGKRRKTQEEKQKQCWQHQGVKGRKAKYHCRPDQ